MKINGLLISVGVLYGQRNFILISAYIKEIKGELEAHHGVKISKKTTDTQVYYLSKQLILGCTESKICSYCFIFDIDHRLNESLYRLTYFYSRHDTGCVDPYKAEILKRKRFLEEHGGALRKIMEYQYLYEDKIENPRVIIISIIDSSVDIGQ